MKHFISLAALALIAFAPSAVTAQTVNASANTTAYDRAPWWIKTPVITQTGYVFAEIPANRADFSATFLSVDDDEAKAQAKAIAMTRELQDALARLGSDKVRVTTDFTMKTLYQQYTDKNGNKVDNERGDKINGYEVSIAFNIEVRDMTLLQNAYSLVMAAQPTSSDEIYFDIQADNATNTWLYTEAVKDAHTRALQGAEAAGGKLGAVLLIDPTGRACRTDILARGAPQNDDYGDATQVVVTGMRRAEDGYSSASQRKISSASAGVTLEDRALQNPFIQTPPLKKLTATACVVYGLN